ncbi:CHAT domain-containing protein [Flavilitoribacter nigricans]|nr:CHAT domain-containing protein [Flavilitoribacter nigricans]
MKGYKSLLLFFTYLMINGVFAQQAPPGNSDNQLINDTFALAGKLTQARMLIDSNKLDEAKELLLAANGLIEKNSLSQSIYQYDYLHESGRIIYEGKDYQTSFSIFEHALLLLTDTLQIPDSTRIANSLYNIGNTFIGEKDFKNAETYHRQALDIRERLPDVDSVRLSMSYNNMGYIYQNQRKLEKALESHHKALEIRKKVLPYNHVFISDSYRNIGLIYEHQQKYQDAISCYQKIIQIERASDRGKDKLNDRLVRALSGLGFALVTSGNAAEAEGVLDEGLRELEKFAGAKNSKEGYRIIFDLGNLQLSKGAFKKAKEFYLKAGEIAKELLGEGSYEYGSTLFQLGIISHDEFRVQEGLNYINQALQSFEARFGKESIYSAYAYNELGNLYYVNNELEKSQTAHQKSLDIKIKYYGDQNPAAANSYNGLANVYLKQKKFEEAVLYNKKALALRIKYLGPHNYETIMGYMNVYNNFIAMGQLDSAANYLPDITKLPGDLNQFTRAIVVLNTGSFYGAKEEPKLARYYLNKSMEMLREVFGAKHGLLGKAFQNSGLLLENTDLDSALIRYDEALAAFNYNESDLENTNSPDQVLISLNRRAGIFYRQEKLREAKNDLIQAKKLALSILALSPPEFLHSVLSHHKLIIENSINVNGLTVDEPTNCRDCFQDSERAKSLLLYQSIQESNALRFAGIPDSLLIEENDLRLDITYYEKKRQESLNKGLSEADTSVLAIGSQLYDLRQKYELLKQRFERDFPDYFQLKYNFAIATVEDVQKELLASDQALLEYFVGDSSIFIFVIREDGFQMVEVKKNFPLTDWVNQLTRNISVPENFAYENYLEPAYQLYEKLIAPVADLLPERVVIIPDGVLGYLPFEALLTSPENLFNPAAAPYLINKHEISYNYSATLLKEMQQKKIRQLPTKDILAMAPFSDQDTIRIANLDQDNWINQKRDELLSPLPFSGIELDSLSEIFPTDAFHGSEATEERFAERAGEYRILHLATHGRADARSGDYSYLAFTPIPDSLENELLYVRDLYNLQLNADLVVLSACETGIGELQNGEGIISLARAFAYAGTKSIATTLWRINDKSTQEVMVSFYHYLKAGLRKDSALRKAKLDFLQKYGGSAAHPALWSGVILIGDTAALY